MAEVSSLQEKILQAASQYLKSLEKDQEGQITSVEFSKNLLPPGTNLETMKNFLFNLARTISLEELFERKEEIIGLLDQVSQAIPSSPPVAIPKKEEITIRPDGKGEKQIRITGLEEVKETIANLSRQAKRLRMSPKSRGKERIVYESEEEPLISAGIQQEVRETIQAIEEKLNQELQDAIPKHPQLEKELKNKEEVSQLARNAAQKVEKSLLTITDANQAVNVVQAVLQQETDLPLQEAYDLAKKVIPDDVAEVATRRRIEGHIDLARNHQRLTDTFKSALYQAGFSPPEVGQAISLLDPAVDKVLTGDFSQKQTDVASEIFRAVLSPALSKDGLPEEKIELASEALASSRVIKNLQKLAETTTQWEATVPLSLQRLAFETTVPEETKKIASEIKRFVVQFSLGKTPSTREEVKTEQLATEATRNLIRKRIEIVARAKQRGLRGRIPAGQISQEEIIQIVEEIVLETLNPEKYGTDFVEKVKESLKKTELPTLLLENVREVLETPPPQLSPLEKERAVTTVKDFLTKEILLGKITPRDEVPIREIAQATVEEMVNQVQISPLPIERPIQVREITLRSLGSALDQYERQYPSLVRKAQRGVAAARAAEKLPSSLLENLQETIQALPPRLLRWEEEEISKLVDQGILPPAERAAYQKSIAQGKDQAFLSPITPPGIAARTLEERMASSFLTSRRKEKEKLSEKTQFLIEEAEKIAPQNKAVRGLFSRLFRLLTGEKDPSQALDRLIEAGPRRMNFPSQFRQEIFRRFINTLFWKGGWRRVDRSTGESYSRFGRDALKNAFSRVTSPLKRGLTQGIKRALRAVGRLLTKAIKPVLSMLGKLVAPALNAIAGLLGKLLPALLGFALQVAGGLMNLLGLIGSTVGLPITLIVLAAIFIIIIIFLIIRGFLLPGAYVDYYLEPESGSCNLSDPIMSSGILSAFFQQAGEAFKIPAGVVAGVAYIEGEHLWGYSDVSIITYSQPEAQDPINCDPNRCGARGPMQFLAGEGGNIDKCPQACEEVDRDGNCVVWADVWSRYKEAVNEALNEGRNPHVCNIKDSIFAAAKMLKERSQTTPENNCVWNKEQVYNAARGFYGKCEYTAEWEGKIITGDYCKRVWEYYINSSTEPIIYP